MGIGNLRLTTQQCYRKKPLQTDNAVLVLQGPGFPLPPLVALLFDGLWRIASNAESGWTLLKTTNEMNPSRALQSLLATPVPLEIKLLVTCQRAARLQSPAYNERSVRPPALNAAGTDGCLFHLHFTMVTFDVHFNSLSRFNGVIYTTSVGLWEFRPNIWLQSW